MKIGFVPRLLSVVLLLVAPFAAYGATGEVVEYIQGNGAVNWTRGQVVVESTAGENRSRYKACRASIVAARRDMVEMIGQVRIDSDTLISDGVLQKELIRSTLSGQLRGGRVIGRQMNPDGTCSVKLSVALSGPLARMIFGRDLPVVEKVEKSPPSAEPSQWSRELARLQERVAKLEELLNKRPELAEEVARQRSEAEPTGLVIDVRGSNFVPSMLPRLRDGSGAVIFPQDGGQAMGEGRLLSLFMNDLTEAQNHPRVGAKPLLIKAAQTWTEAATEMVLDAASAARLAGLAKTGLLGRLAMIIVMD